MNIDPNTLVVIIVVALVCVVLGVLATSYLLQKRQTKRLRERFGPEYGRTLTRYHNRHKAEAALEARKERVERLDIKLLDPAARDRFTSFWRTTQARFVDHPAVAVAEAEILVQEVLRARGYPVADFEQRAADVSVDHPHVVEHYRAARNIAHSSEKGQAGTEDLRRAMIHYRALFEDLLETYEHELEPVGASR